MTTATATTDGKAPSVILPFDNLTVVDNSGGGWPLTRRSCSYGDGVGGGGGGGGSFGDGGGGGNGNGDGDGGGDRTTPP